MTDPFDALRPPRRPLPAGGDERAVARGRRVIHRRRVAYGGVMSAGLVAVGAVATLGRDDSAHDSIRYLDPDESPTPTPEPTGSATPSPGPVLPTILPTAIGLPPLPGGSSEPQPTTSAEPDPTPAPRGPYVGPEPVDADGAAIVTRTTSTDRTFCATGAQQQVSPYNQGWCSAVSGSSLVHAGHSTPYSFTLCRQVDKGDGTLHFATRKEADFGVAHWNDPYTESTPVWQAGAHAQLPSEPHTLTVPAGDCVTWTTTWGGQDNDGYAAPQESNELDAVPWAEEFIGDDADLAAPVAFLSVDVRWS
jgi:hypothetical protein